MPVLSTISKESPDQKSSRGLVQGRKPAFFKPFIQPKLTINRPNDIYEQEADSMADRVMRMTGNINMHSAFFNPVISSLQRKCEHCEEEEKNLQRKKMNGEEKTADNGLENYIGGLAGAGKPLSNAVRDFFEPRFGYDFSNVKVHTDGVASRSAQSINALAYTSGNDIVFSAGQYSPDTDSGKRLLAHELTHTVQQDAGIGRRIQRAFNPGRCCNESVTGADEWALVSTDDPQVPTVWQRLSVGQCVGNPLDTDCEGMTCGGGFYTVQGWTTLLAPGTCRTPGQDDFFMKITGGPHQAYPVTTRHLRKSEVVTRAMFHQVMSMASSYKQGIIE